MNFNLSLLTPEIAIAVAALLLLCVGLLTPAGPRKGMFALSAAAVGGILGYTVYDFFFGTRGTAAGMLVDDFSVFFNVLFLSAVLLVILSSKDYVQKYHGYRGEFYPMIISATLGMMIMASAGDLITLYVGLEVMTISFYILVGYLSYDGRSSEAGMKYLVLGAASSAVLLYGISLIYGLTGTTNIGEIAQVFGVISPDAQGFLTPTAIFASILMLAGFGFKISLIPFHMWAPDIYEGAPTPVTALLAVASKAAGFAAFIRVYLLMMWGSSVLAHTGLMILVGLAAVTMIVGNLMAIPQTNIKRLLAYSSIAQAGYLTVGVIAASELGVKGVLFYAMIYVFANMGAFAVAAHVGQAQGSDEIADYAGLAKRSPVAAAVMTASLLSLAGIPPLAGFVGKFYLFSAFVDSWVVQQTPGLIALAYIGFIMSMVSVYYYLKVVKTMYLTEGEGLPDIPVKGASKFTMVFTFVITLVLGLYPTPLAQMAIKAALGITLW